MKCKKCGEEFNKVDDIELCHACYIEENTIKPTKINFSISEISGRTFELDSEKLSELYLKCDDGENGIQTDLDEKIRVIINDLGFDALSQFEKANDYYEWNIEEINEVQ